MKGVKTRTDYHWGEIIKIAEMLGFFRDDEGKGDPAKAFRLRNWLVKEIEAGRVEQLGEGHYNIP